MLLSKAAYSSEEQELSIAHVKAVWFFKCHFLPCWFQTFLVVPAPFLRYRIVPFRTGALFLKQWLEDHHWFIGMFVGCRNNERSRLWGASTNEPVSVASEMAWNQRHERVMPAIAMSLATTNPTHTHTRVHHMLKNHLCRSFYKRLAAILHSRRPASSSPSLFLLLFPKASSMLGFSFSCTCREGAIRKWREGGQRGNRGK